MKKIGRPLSTVVYAIYKGDTFIDVGTKRELAERMKLAESTITHLASKTYWGRIRGKETRVLLAIKVEGE